jgi:hypothetical protein
MSSGVTDFCKFIMSIGAGATADSSIVLFSWNFLPILQHRCLFTRFTRRRRVRAWRSCTSSFIIPGTWVVLEYFSFLGGYYFQYSSTHLIRRTLRKAIKALVFANKPCTRAWSTRLAIGYNPRVKIGVKIFSRESYELKSNFRGFYFHRSATFPHTTHIQF